MAEPPIRRTSIAAKLTLMNILVSGIGLLLAFVSFLAYDLYIYRQSSVRSLEGLAAMVGQSSIDAIGKGDRAEGQSSTQAVGENGVADKKRCDRQRQALCGEFKCNSEQQNRWRPS